MKKSLLAIFAFLCFTHTAALAGDLKISIVDMTRVFAEYYKTKDAIDFSDEIIRALNKNAP